MRNSVTVLGCLGSSFLPSQLVQDDFFCPSLPFDATALAAGFALAVLLPPGVSAVFVLANAFLVPPEILSQVEGWGCRKLGLAAVLKLFG